MNLHTVSVRWPCSFSIHLKPTHDFLNACKSINVKHTKCTQRHIQRACKAYSLLSTFWRIILHYDMQSPREAHWKLSKFHTLPQFFDVPTSSLCAVFIQFLAIPSSLYYKRGGGILALLVQEEFFIFILFVDSSRLDYKLNYKECSPFQVTWLSVKGDLRYSQLQNNS